MTAPDHRARFITAAMRAVQFTTEAVLALVDYAAEKRAPTAPADDPQWGYVSRAQLPDWISAEQWADACALGQIDGARKSGRSWVAPRASTLAWALAAGRSVRALAMVAAWSKTHGTEYTAERARAAGIGVDVRVFGGRQARPVRVRGGGACGVWVVSGRRSPRAALARVPAARRGRRCASGRDHCGRSS